MSDGQARSNMFPGMRYKDAPAAIEWLGAAFGFEPKLVVPGGEGVIAHAQLQLGSGMIMLGSVSETEYGQYIKQPDDVGGCTQSAYIVVQAIDEHYERAKAAGAEILMELADQDYGGRVYTARDPEGHVWNFGSYDPWED